VEPARTCKTLLPGAQSIHGIKLAANVWFLTRVEETPMLLITTPMDQLMSDFGKSTTSTGDSAAVEALLAIPLPTSIAPSRSTDGEETPGNSGAPTLLAAADLSLKNLIHIY
jgi:hypothetical protein